jgi:hypothetical protein
MNFDLWFTQLLISLDQMFQVLFSGPYYLLFGGDCPQADETISSRVGKAAEQGKKWALVCERCINRLFSHFGDDNHCRKHVKICKCNETQED